MKIAYLFPGQGSQQIGMGKDFYEHYTSAKQIFELADKELNFSLSKLCFDGPQEQLNLTANTQPALLTVSAAISSVLKELKDIPNPDIVAGHSLGEYTALWYSGVIPINIAVALVRKRGLFMQDAVPAGIGAMAAIIGLPLEKVQDLCNKINSEKSVVQPANFNAPGQTVISGHKDAVLKAIEIAKEKGARKGILLPVSAPFHCNLMKPAAEKMAVEINQCKFNKPLIDIINNADAKLLEKDEDVVKDSLIRQITASVKWEQSIKLMDELGIDTFIEIGSGRVLTNLVKRILPHSKRFAVSSVEDLFKVRDYFSSEM